MALEIERKFLVINGQFKAMCTSEIEIEQGYLSLEKERTIRIRLKRTEDDEHAVITVKGENRGAVRNEWEYDIPVEDARGMMALCVGNIISKTRHIVPYRGFTWEVDVFHGAHDGLVLAEVELPSADASPELPPFLGREVTDDSRYYNSSLAQRACKM